MFPRAGARARPEDREYGANELWAFFLSWLAALPPPVVNPPSVSALSGSFHSSAEWTRLAAQSGLPVSPWQAVISPGPNEYFDVSALGNADPSTPRRTVFVVGDVVLPCPAYPPLPGGASPPLPSAIMTGVRNLARTVSASLLSVDFLLEPGAGTPQVFAGAETLPDLRLGGEPLLDALAAMLLRSGASTGRIP